MVSKRSNSANTSLGQSTLYDQREMFQNLYDTHFRVLVGYAFRYIKVETDAEDIVQEVFLLLWAKRATFSERSVLLKILYTSVRNRCIDHLKHQMVERGFSAQIDIEPEDNIESEIFAAEIYSRLFHYIDNLPPRQRVLIQLAIDGKRNYEIAKEMQISIETVKRQKRNAIDKLRALFKQDEDLLLLLLLNSIVEV